MLDDKTRIERLTQAAVYALNAIETMAADKLEIARLNLKDAIAHYGVALRPSRPFDPLNDYPEHGEQD